MAEGARGALQGKPQKKASADMNQWYVLFTKPRKEAHVQQQLEEKGVDTFLPMMPRKQGNGRQVGRPLFPRYLFAQLERFPGGVAAARWTPGLTSLLSFGGEYAVVQDEVLDYVRGRVRVEERNARAPFRRGQRVRFSADCPLGLLEAIFEQELSGGKRAYVLIEILGRLTRTKVGIEDIRRIAPARGLCRDMERSFEH